MKVQDLELHVGAPVMYVPYYANGSTKHPDCLTGTVSSWNDTYVFVDYGDGRNIATRPDDLIWI